MSASRGSSDASSSSEDEMWDYILSVMRQMELEESEEEASGQADDGQAGDGKSDASRDEDEEDVPPPPSTPYVPSRLPPGPPPPKQAPPSSSAKASSSSEATASGPAVKFGAQDIRTNVTKVTYNAQDHGYPGYCPFQDICISGGVLYLTS